MYLEYFGLRERPFSIAPDPYYLFMSEQHREALAHLLYGIQHDGGFILLSGEVGTGKTTICRCLLEQMPEDTEFAFVMNTKLTAVELLESVCQEFGMDTEGAHTVKGLADRINHFLLDVHARRRKAVLIIDEAQNLEMDVLEQVRLLTNLETTSSKLLQIILLGQPELRQKLERPEMRQLAQRITARYHLHPLSRAEVVQYVAHRLSVAGTRRRIFTDKALDALYDVSKGVPRLINLVCDRALLGAYSMNRELVDADIIRRAAAEVQGDGSDNRQAPRMEKWMRIAAPILLVLFLGGIGFFLDYRRQDNTPTDVTTTAPVARETKEVVESKALKEEPTVPAPAARAEAIDEEEVPKDDAGKAPATPQEAVSPVVKGKEDENPAPAAETTGDLPFNLAPWKHELPAHQALFSLWGIPYESRMSQPCRHAEKNGLRCYAGNGSLEEIRRINRPVYFRLEGPAGKKEAIFAVLAELRQDMAVLASGGERISVPLKELIYYWSGQYMLLWRPPSGYTDSVRPGHSGEVVSWIDENLAKVQGRVLDGPPKTLYDDDLVRRVKEFQFANGLTPDGITGTLTLIQLSAQTDENVPVLSKER